MSLNIRILIHRQHYEDDLLIKHHDGLQLHVIHEQQTQNEWIGEILHHEQIQQKTE